ncbi:hypothetical protein [Salinimonas sediminis]|uniref:Uncharacterized protein n=1 Tax=Salinimonas sediminis TaxID=2303538 RepID=A0A346NQ09_9ALTE|nr:hypothetical protein [Salinimonas sediminis]AXR07616.1 hypothetical protein D0Y50_15370 [Salinimonas sediminis]
MKTLNTVEIEIVSGAGVWSGLSRLVTGLDLVNYGYKSVTYMQGFDLNHNSHYLSAATNRL